jgi:predicted Zn-dependent protease
MWSVSTVVGPDEFTDNGTFSVITEAERAAVKSELKGLESDADGSVDDEVMNGALQAEIYRKHDLFDEAVAIYDALLKQNPDSVALHLALAEILSGLNRFDAAKLHLNQAQQLENAG